MDIPSNQRTNICVLFICDKPYFDRFIQTYNQLREAGKYSGDVCLIVFYDLYTDPEFQTFMENNTDIHIQYFPPIPFTPSFYENQSRITRDGHWNQKMFQFQKYYLFHPFLRKWDYVFYLDCGIQIYRDIQPMLDCALPNTLLAHSNCYPYFEQTLKDGFWKSSSLFSDLENKYKLDIDYPQTTIMLYDTELTSMETFYSLIGLSIQYPISITNDQSIIALYFTNVCPVWKQIPLENEECAFYDYLRRSSQKKPYIMLKVSHIMENNKKIEFI